MRQFLIILVHRFIESLIGSVMEVCSVNYQLSIRINDRHGSMRIDNGYYNKDYGLLAK